MGDWPRRLSLLVFFWGGGLLTLTGVVYYRLILRTEIQHLFAADPASGWWFLNFGRNLIYPTEAFYHALFFAGMLLALRGRYHWAALVTLVASLSHPYTGIEMIAVLWGWAFVESFWIRRLEGAQTLLWWSSGLLLFHLGYYLWFLGLFPEHRSVQQQISVNWNLRLRNMVPAYLLVALLAFFRVRRSDWKDLFSSAAVRLCAVWFLVVFAAANHEKLGLKPVVPIHFERGYIWTALFFLGAPALVCWFGFLLSMPRRAWAAAGLAATLSIFLADNAIWLGRFARSFPSDGGGIFLTRPQKELLNWMNRAENRGRVVLSQDRMVDYLATVYTPLRSWAPQPMETPYFAVRKAELDGLFQRGAIAPVWQRMPVLIVALGDRSQLPERARLAGPQEVFHNTEYTVFRWN